MLSQRIEILTKKMNLIKEYDQIKVENERKRTADNKYRILAFKVEKMITSYIYARDILDFRLSEASIVLFNETLSLCKNVVENNMVDLSKLNKAEKKYISAYENIKSEWKYFFTDLTSNLIQTLNIFRELKGEEIVLHVSSIQKSSTWQEDNSKIDNLKESIKNAENYLSKINTNPKINNFLSKINSNKATVKDLDSELLEWIKKENLSHRIKLKF